MADRLPPLYLGPEYVPSKYQQAIRLRLPNIHTARARAIVLGGDIFYSPNCSYIPQLPSNDGKPFYRVSNKDDVEEIQRPLWWVQEMAYLPFVPKQPAFHIVPFDKLYSNPSSIQIGKNIFRKQMDSDNDFNWTDVEKTLCDVYAYLRSAYGIPEMQNIISSTFLCSNKYDNLSQYRSAEKRCRKWFAAWMGLISFGIAVAQTSDNEGSGTPMPQWMNGLLRFYDPHIAAGIRQELALFSDYSPRAGVFFKIMEEPYQQPVVDFFVRWNIPIWYPWGEREEYYLLRYPKVWGAWKPPTHLLQKARSFLLKAPVASHSPLSDREPAWKVFIERRHGQVQELEKSGAKLLNLARKVFVWEKDEVGKWKRITVLKRDQEAVLAEYGAAQKYYDKFTNEWDCCEDKGLKTAEELLEDAWDNPQSAPVAPVFSPSGPSDSIVVRLPLPESSSSKQVRTTEAQVQPETRSQRALTTMAPPTHANTTGQMSGPAHQMTRKNLASDAALYEPEIYSPENTLYLLYGFTYPTSRSSLRLPNYPVKTEAGPAKAACGAPTIPDSYFESVTGQAAIDFIKYLNKPDTAPRNELYDLSLSNHKAIRKSKRLRTCQRLPGDIFVVKCRDHAAATWSLAVEGSLMLLLVLRLDEDWNEYRLAYELLNRGARFYTLHLSSSPFSPSDHPSHIPRVRLSSNTFSNKDYELYKQECAHLLCDPRIGRAAAKEGGILWRLSISSVSYNGILDGPTANATVHKQCKMFNPGDGQRVWLDDYLQDSEKNILCGAYQVYTGRGEQQATMSWWPTANLWDELIAFPIWNDKLESIYLTRLKELESGSAKPRTASEWRKTLRAHSIARRCIGNATKAGNAFLLSALNT